MADNNPEDLVSQVSVQGTEESLAKLDAYASGGAKAFDKLNASAQVASKGVAAAGANIDDAGKRGAAGFSALGAAANSTGDIAGKIKDIEKAVSNLTSKFPALTQAVGRFSQRLALVGAAAVAAGVGLASSAAKVAKAVDGQSDSLQKQTDAQIQANDAALQAELGQINFAASIRKLDRDLATGKISYDQYRQSIQQLQFDQQEQIRTAAQVAAAQDRTKEANDRLTKSLKDRQAFQGLVDTFGGPLLTAMTAFGRQAEAIHTQIIAAFGPSAAAVINTISNTLSQNSVAIGKFFDEASQKINALLSTNGPQIQKLLENIGKAASSVFVGIINAAPGLIDFFNNALVPAISKVAVAFDGIAAAINFVFGTKLTGGSIVLIAIIAQVTGSIRLLFALVRTGGAIFKGFISVIEAVGIALGEAFSIKAVGNVAKIGAAIAKGGGPFKTFLALIRTLIPVVTTLGAALASALGIGLGPAILIIAAVSAALIFLLTRVDWKAFAAAASAAITEILAFLQTLLQGAINIVTGIIAAFAAVNAFFNQLAASLASIFVATWAAIVAGAVAAAAALVTAWNAVAGAFSAIVASIAGFFSGLWDGIVAAATAAAAGLALVWATVSKAIQTAFTTVVTFFQGLPATLQLVWDTIKQAIIDAFDNAVTAVTNAFQSLLTAARGFLQPIIDLLNTIASLGGGVGAAVSGAGGNAAGFDGGGAVHGPGGGTDDLIPAWLSNGEFVVKARSVAKYGAGLLRAINEGRFTMPRFALGGLVSAVPRVAYAAGGEVKTTAAMRPLSLSIFGEQFSGMMAPEDVGDRLAKFAVERQNKSAGRKPAWLGRGRN